MDCNKDIGFTIYLKYKTFIHSIWIKIETVVLNLFMFESYTINYRIMY